jgi:Holliday junction resolvase RusA-like endonuclease|tara:strand:+ start:133 stop:531 length:399 start_codon:yes stop_codon:yes gene_type:complete
MAIDKLLEPENINWEWEATILGEPASKSNQRQIVRMGGKPRLIKSKKALAYARQFHLQAPRMPLRDPILDDVLMWCRIHYATRRPDLDESLIMDALQAAEIIGNDRQIKAKVVLWALDRENPRSEIKLACLS